jgi:hypothetical protein
MNVQTSPKHSKVCTHLICNIAFICIENQDSEPADGGHSEVSNVLFCFAGCIMEV